jgi:hypothetical protein
LASVCGLRRYVREEFAQNEFDTIVDYLYRRIRRRWWWWMHMMHMMHIGYISVGRTKLYIIFTINILC